MFRKILVAHRGDDGRQAVAAQPERMAHVVRAGDLAAIEVLHV
ncbi:MAG TPA: hypothetical protein PLT38_11540 [Rubrivivax sp.]|nr:hypothetical protein [Rubrivivax sp.]HOL38450.1 hypothetical protein [Rubrivivax sp.]